MTQNIHQHLDVAFMTLKVLLDEGRCVERRVYLSSRYDFHRYARSHFLPQQSQHMATYEGITRDSNGLVL